MNIVWIVNKYFDVSVDRTTWVEIAKHLINKKNNLLLLTNYKERKESFGLGASIKYLPSLKVSFLNFLSSNLVFFAYLCYQVIFKKPDVVVVHPMGILSVFPLGFLRKLKLVRTRFVLDIRTIPVEVFGFQEKIHEVIFDFSVIFSKYFFDGITVISPFMKTVLSEKYMLDKEKIGVWASGVSLEAFDSTKICKKSLEKLQREMNLKDKFVIIYHGVFTESRGLFETMKAVNVLKEQYSDIVFLILGNGYARNELEASVKRLKLSDNVVIKGPVSHEEVPTYISLAHIGILPFPDFVWWRVSSPIKLMEYLAMGKPVVVTEIEAHREVLGKSNCGFFVKSNQLNDLTAGIVTAYENRNCLSELGADARSIVQNNFTWERQAELLEQYMKSLI